MRAICTFCGYGSPDEEGRQPINHDPDCSRNDENAEELFDEGYRAGKRYDNHSYEETERTRTRAWKAGWRSGDAAYDEWFNS